MSEESPEYPIDEDGFNPNVPPNPDRWWKARRNHAGWAAVALMITTLIFSLLVAVAEADVISASVPVFIAVIIAQASIVISYIVSASMLDKVIRPFSKIPGIG